MSLIPPHNPITPELYRPVTVTALKIGPSRQSIETTEEERRRLADRFGLLALTTLSASLQLTRKGQGQSIRITVTGQIKASIMQSCVVTLDPVSTDINTPFSILFDSEAEEDKIDCDPEPDSNTIVEPIVGDIIDLGEMLAQVLAVEIDPFPRREEVSKIDYSASTPDRDHNPFAILQKLKDQN